MVPAVLFKIKGKSCNALRLKERFPTKLQSHGHLLHYTPQDPDSYPSFRLPIETQSEESKLHARPKTHFQKAKKSILWRFSEVDSQEILQPRAGHVHRSAIRRPRCRYHRRRNGGSQLCSLFGEKRGSVHGVRHGWSVHLFSPEFLPLMYHSAFDVWKWLSKQCVLKSLFVEERILINHTKWVMQFIGCVV